MSLLRKCFVIDNEEDVDAGMTEADTKKIPIHFERDKVKDPLLSLRTDKPTGPDGPHPIVLQICAEEISLPMSLIFQKSFDTGQLPTDWKLAVVSPIFKKGKKCDAGNYRPVSLTSVPCKIMEPANDKTELVKYMDNSGVMNSSQHGFTKGRSCLEPFIETFEAWTRILEEGYGVDVVFLDFRKAFDSVSHVKLLQKLRSYRIEEKMVN